MKLIKFTQNLWELFNSYPSTHTDTLSRRLAKRCITFSAALLSFVFLSLFACSGGDSAPDGDRTPPTFDGDRTPPTLSSANLRETTRTLTLNFSEATNNTSGEIDLSKLFISEAGQSNQMPLTGARIVTEGNSETTSIRLTEPQWQAASALMMPQLDVQASAVKDLSGNEIADSADIAIRTITGILVSVAEINSSNTNGLMLSNDDAFGVSVAALGDLDGDDIIDLAVGADGDGGGGFNRGALHILFMNRDGSVESTTEIDSSTMESTMGGSALSNGDRFGVSVAVLGDLNNDDITELAVGANAGGSNGGGAAHILFMDSNGSVKSTVEINSSTTNELTLSNGDFFGSSIAALGDLDGDGITELAVGADGDNAGGSNRGTVHILFMDSNGSVKSTVEINSSTTSGLMLLNHDRIWQICCKSGRSEW